MSLTPVDVERKLTALVSEITTAQQELRHAREAETDALVAHKRAVLTAAHDGDCPRVARGGATVADREAFIDSRTVGTWEALKRAETAREVCQDRLRAVLAVSEVVRSLGSSVRTAYAMAGVGQP